MRTHDVIFYATLRATSRQKIRSVTLHETSMATSRKLETSSSFATSRSGGSVLRSVLYSCLPGAGAQVPRAILLTSRSSPSKSFASYTSLGRLTNCSNSLLL